MIIFHYIFFGQDELCISCNIHAGHSLETISASGEDHYFVLDYITGLELPFFDNHTLLLPVKASIKILEKLS